MGDSEDIDWNFEDSYLWRNKFTECMGDNQSPVNIDTSNLTPCNLLCELETKFKSSECNVNYNKHNMIKIKYPPGSISLFNNNIYNLKYITIHTPSLHTIDNESFDMEICMVHETDITPGKNTSDNDNGLILCRLLNRSYEEYGAEEKFINEFIHQIPNTPMMEDDYKKISVSNEWGVNLLTPKVKNSFFYYNGSLPYPTCTDKYSIIVYENIGNIGDTNYRILKENLGSNNRPVQYLGTRKIFYNSGKTIRIEDRIKEDIVSDNKFLQCAPVKDIKKTTESAEITETPDDEILSIRISNRIKNIILFVIVIALFMLALFLIKYLYKQFEIQKFLKKTLPPYVVTKERFEQWERCSGKKVPSKSRLGYRTPMMMGMPGVGNPRQQFGQSFSQPLTASGYPRQQYPGQAQGLYRR